MERREVLKMGVSAFVLYVLQKNNIGPPMPTVEQKKAFDVFGLVDVPNVGGPINHELAINDLKTLGAKKVVSLDPDRRYLEKLIDQRFLVIDRVYLQDNKFNEKALRANLQKFNNLGQRPIVQPFNEVNLLEETAGFYIEPEKHVKETFLPAAKEIINERGMALVTPMAQRSEIDEEEYFVRMLKQIKESMPAVIIRKDIGVSIHNYTFTPDEDSMYRLKKIGRIVRNCLGMSVPLYVTEAGLYQDSIKSYPSDVVGIDIIRVLNTGLPTDLNIGSYCFWVLANNAQRENSDNTLLMQNFEQAALRGADNKTAAYDLIAQYAHAQSKLYKY